MLLRAREIFRGHAHFRAKPRPISIVLRQIISSSSPIDLFSKEFLLKHSKVSHSSSFLSSVARKRGSIYLTSVYFLVLGVAQRGVPVHPWIPLWIRHWDVELFCFCYRISEWQRRYHARDSKPIRIPIQN